MKQKSKSVNPTIFIVDSLYTKKTGNWILELEDRIIDPFIIQNFLVMDDRLRVQTRWLDKYVFALPPKMFVSLAWTVIPKEGRGYVPYIKKRTEEETFWFILNRIRKHFQLADNDYNSIKMRLIDAIKKDLVGWFSFYGIPKKHWDEFYLNFNLIKDYGEKHIPKPKGLEEWGM